MNLPAVLVLIVGIALLGCSNATLVALDPTPNINATVEARLRQEQPTKSTTNPIVTNTAVPNLPATLVPSSSAGVDLVETVGNILDLYEGNEFAADATLTGKWVEMRGKVEKVESVDGKIEVNLVGTQDMFRMNNLVCKVSADQTDEAVVLRKDDVVVVTGKVLGITGLFNVVAEPCKLPSQVTP